MAQNPSYEDVTVGDTFTSSVHMSGGNAWIYTSFVRKVYPIELRFGNLDRIVTVTIRSSSGQIIDHKKHLWVSQLLEGLV